MPDTTAVYKVDTDTEFRRYNVYVNGHWIADFVIPTHKLDDLCNEFAEACPESAVEKLIDLSPDIMDAEICVIFDDVFYPYSEDEVVRNSPVTVFIYNFNDYLQK